MSYVFQQKFEEASSKNGDLIAKILFLHVLPLLKIKNRIPMIHDLLQLLVTKMSSNFIMCNGIVYISAISCIMIM